MKKVPIIAIDIGGTIEDAWNSKQIWFELKGFNIGNTPMGRREVISCIGGDEALYEAMVKEVYNDENIISREVVVGFLDAIKIISSYCKVIILSSRDEEKRNVTIEWMKTKKIYGFIDEIIFLGDKGNKLEWCVNSNVKILVDDDIRHLESIEENASITKIHFGQFHQKNTNIINAITWEEIVTITKNIII